MNTAEKGIYVGHDSTNGAHKVYFTRTNTVRTCEPCRNYYDVQDFPDVFDRELKLVNSCWVEGSLPHLYRDPSWRA